MGKSTPSAPSPDPMIGKAAMKNAKIGEDWLDFMRGQATISNEWAAEDRERYQKVFQPLEDKFIKEADSWDSEQRQAKLAREARADVMGEAALAGEARSRSLAALGVDPTSGRYRGIERGADLDVALAAAGAQNVARNQARQQGVALRADAAGMGKGLPSQALGALTATNSSMGNAFSGAQQGYTNQANVLNDQYRTQVSAWQTEASLAQQGMGGLFSGLGTIAGLAFMKSDEDAKEDKAPSKDNLAKVRGLPIEEWTYKEGEGDGGRHTGTYAQDFQRETGKGDGKTIPIVDAIGVTMGAVKELDAKVSRIEKAVTKRSPARGRGIIDDRMAA